MKTITKRPLMLLMLLVLLLVTACGTSAPLAERTTVMTSVERHEIVNTGLTEVESQLAPQLAPQSQIVPVVDNNKAMAAITGLEESLVNVYKQANPSVVYIMIPLVGAGSGFVYSQEGYIVTNNHVVNGLRTFEVVFANGTRRRAQLVGADLDSDLAVVKVDQLPNGIQPLPLAPNNVQVGQFVMAIGSPFGEEGSMSFGIVSGLGRSLESQRDLVSGSNYSLPQVIQTDAAINPGNSGGPLLNLNGEVVGVNAAIATTRGSTLANSGVGFSIPVGAVRQIVPSLIKDGSYQYPYMGIGFDDEVSLDEQSVYGISQTDGAYVLRVTPGSPAAEAGLRGANSNTGRGGDLIVAINDQPIHNFSDLNTYLLFNTKVGQTIRITVLRNGQRIVQPLTLGARP